MRDENLLLNLNFNKIKPTIESNVISSLKIAKKILPPND